MKPFQLGYMVLGVRVTIGLQIGFTGLIIIQSSGLMIGLGFRLSVVWSLLDDKLTAAARANWSPQLAAHPKP